MTNELTTTNQDDIVRHEPVALEVAGRQANQAAAEHVIVDYLTRRASKTIQTQAAGLALFAEYLDAAGGLGAAMRQFADDVGSWAGGEGVRPDAAAWHGVTWGIVEGFVKWLLQRGYAVATVNNRLSAVKVYAKLAEKAGVIPRPELLAIKDVSGYSAKEAKRIDERRDVTRVGDKKAEHVSLTIRQADKLKGMKTYEGPQGARDRLLMCLLIDHGLRVSEVAGLRVTDFDLEAGEIHFYRPKVDKAQTHEMTPDTKLAATEYILNHAPTSGRAIVGSVKGGGLTGRPMSQRAITKRVRQLGRKILGIDNLSAHDCRHFWATYWAGKVEEGKISLFRLQEAGGWDSLRMPRHYVEEAKIANKGMA